ncbi:MAG: TatD family hydrolase [Thioalkalispiraceae bacterium]|jgi:TatD DNase family protein
MLVDSHCHLDRLDLTPYDGKLQGALDQAREMGVTHFLCVCIDLEHLDDVLTPAKEHTNIFASVGVHPNEHEGHEPTMEELVKLADNENVIAIGETGLDYFRSEGSLDWQRERFRQHIAASKATDKPLIIHMRDATEDTLRIMKEEDAGEVGGVMHCFVEDWEVAKRALDLNFYISFSGIVTFKNARELKQVAKKLPEDKMLVETDSPYLAPVPYRGKPNQPAYVRHVAEHVAELRGINVEAIGEVTTENFFNLFRHAKQ